MNLHCPQCRLQIPLADVNVATDLALCRSCQKTFSYAELNDQQNVSSVDLRNPPKGAWFHEFPGGFEIGATTRSGAAFFLVPFMCVWSGGSLGGIYGTQIHRGQFDLFSTLFGLPFLLGTLVLGAFTLMTTCGKVVVRREGTSGHIFTGVGPFGWRRRFDWNQLKSVKLTESRGENPSRQIMLEGECKLNFGTGLKAERLDFVLGALRQMTCRRY